ncbi:hypothetical protein Y1Q_0015362 [Alligator mississippiensis]|uniref:Uncharacterized protein n=1 Tax=Alligator mississippiensis TaxID=8496 RepID=A0A151MLA0_ALLMI|nr:hypothetical protein Y1Q_0015362 [Alligator mississippiensis]
MDLGNYNSCRGAGSECTCECPLCKITWSISTASCLISLIDRACHAEQLIWRLWQRCWDLPTEKTLQIGKLRQELIGFRDIG